MSPDTVQVGQTATASVAGFDEHGNPFGIGTPAWSTDQNRIATVNASGVAVGTAPGLTSVIAAVGTVRGGTALTVIPSPVASVSLAPSAVTLNIGLSKQLTVALFDAAGSALTDRFIAWTSSDSTKASVSDGLVSALAAGTVTVTATSEARSASATITVTPVVDAVATVVMSPPTASVPVGQQLQLLASPLDADGNIIVGRRTSWASSAPAVVTVSPAGLVTGAVAGTAVITATIDGKSAVSSITVSDDLVMSIAKPDSIGPIVDLVAVSVIIVSKNGLVSVVAQVQPTADGLYQSPLGFTESFSIGGVDLGSGVWSGSIPIKRLVSGRYRMVVTATDMRGTVGVASTPFLHQYGHAGGSGVSKGSGK